MRRSVPFLLLLFILAIALCLAPPVAPVAPAGAIGGATSGTAQEASSRGGSQDDELEVFVPSEEVPADSSVSFPVDI